MAGAQLIAYDAAGNNPITLVTFSSMVSNGAVGSRILITTASLQGHEASPIPSDFTMTAIPASYLAAGRLAYLKPSFQSGGVLWSVSWGGASYTGPNTGLMFNDADGNFGPPFAGVLPSDSTVALLFNGPATAMSTNNAADYALTTGAATVTNNAGDSTSLISGTPTPTPGTLGNISTRLQVGTGANVMIAGFVVQGKAPKRVLIRAAGPSLTQFGVPDVLVNPQLELHDTASTIGTNDNWQTTQIGGVITADQVAEIQNSGLAPGDPAESAIIATLTPGSYTAIVQGVNGGTGVGLVEVYDLEATSGSFLGNIATRGFVQTGDNAMIGGFIVVTQPTRVVIRASGPSLSQFGVPDVLANPQLELHDVTTSIIAQNDDWQTTQLGGIITGDQVAEIQKSQLAPANAAEAAIIATLQPGNYTAIVRGVNNTPGNALVEVYALH